MGIGEKIAENFFKDFFKKMGAKGLVEKPTAKRGIDFSLIEELCGREHKILDLACGYGRVAIPLAKAGYDVTGIDITPNLVDEARLNAGTEGVKVRFDIGSMTSLPYPDDSFDRIICLWSSFNYLLTKNSQIKL